MKPLLPGQTVRFNEDGTETIIGTSSGERIKENPEGEQEDQ